MEILKHLNEEYNTIFNDLKNLNEYIYKNPELGRKEFKACEAHKNILKKYGFKIREKKEQKLRIWLNTMLFPK